MFWFWIKIFWLPNKLLLFVSCSSLALNCSYAQELQSFVLFSTCFDCEALEFYGAVYKSKLLAFIARKTFWKEMLCKASSGLKASMLPLKSPKLKKKMPKNIRPAHSRAEFKLLLKRVLVLLCFRRTLPTKIATKTGTQGRECYPEAICPKSVTSN